MIQHSTGFNPTRFGAPHAGPTLPSIRRSVGWKYVDAKEESQKYKIGKFILETQRTVEYGSWDDVMINDMPGLEFEEKERYDNDEAEPIVFDSDDSDDCEDLFAGAWDARIAAKRRKLKLNRR
ncbi:hypothetical protein O1611_g9459 [Lasiodiplodia mahajangana]|uniref:Uncharacterized protein n=1 Tax=Lasiodiplodia mahajangana TaxID=1108764 RepID=A0ACC2J9I8_9PEZI|nr:hypothetical protein O1611_g9459 [Lasiodiplodia mahajangana]